MAYSARSSDVILILWRIKKLPKSGVPRGGSQMNYGKLLLLTGTVLAAGVTSIPVASAQDASSEEEIIVTARKREEAIQDVPAAVTAVSAEDLSTYGVTDVQNLSNVAPGLTVSSTGTVNGQLISMRGISNQPSPQLAQTAAVYVDGVYLPRPDAAVFTLDDVERVEVLRGPQGTLYGRNATSGAINIVSRLPGDELRGGLDARYGNYDQVYAAGSLSGPLGNGFSAGISGAYSDRTGYYTNVTTGDDVGGASFSVLRGTLRYVSQDGRLDVRLAGDIVNGESQELFPVTPNALFPLTVFTDDDPWQIRLTQAQQDQSASTRDQDGLALTVVYDLSDQWTLTSITGQRSFESAIVATPNGALLGPAGTIIHVSNDMDTFSQEVRLEYSSSAMDLTLGANYYSEDQHVFVDVQFVNSFSEVEQFAAFANLTAHLTDRFDAEVGLRWNEETRDVRLVATAPAPYAGTYTGSLSDDALIPHFGVNYEITPDVMAYASVSEGYQAGSYNTAPADTSPAPGNQFGVDTVDPEHLTSYEVGLKSQWFNRSLTLNLAAFRSEYRDMQVRTQIEPGLVDFNNAASAIIEGAEVELDWSIGGGFTFFANGAYTDARFEDFCESLTPTVFAVNDVQGTCLAGQVQRGGNRLILAPEYTANVAIDYLRDVGFGEIHGNVSYSYRSSANFSTNESPVTETGSYDSLNARLGLTLGEQGPEFYIYGQNLMNNWTTDYGQLFNPLVGAQIKSAPQTYGVGLRYHF
jgi:iron complex outermembrane recepter protein